MASPDFPDWTRGTTFLSGGTLVSPAQDFPDWTDGVTILSAPVSSTADFPDWTKAIVEATAPLPDPTHLTGLVAWHDASQITGVADGGTLTQWPNLAPSPLYAQAQSGGVSPVLYYSSTASKLVNGKPAVWYQGNDGSTTLPNSVTLEGTGGSWSMFAVGYTTGTGVNAIIDQYQSIRFLQVNNGSLESKTLHTLASQSGVIAGQANLFGAVCSTSTLQTRLNSLAGTAVTVSTADTSGGVLGIGAYQYYEADWWKGPMCEVVGYNRALTSDEISQLEGYLKQKWATP